MYKSKHLEDLPVTDSITVRLDPAPAATDAIDFMAKARECEEIARTHYEQYVDGDREYSHDLTVAIQYWEHARTYATLAQAEAKQEPQPAPPPAPASNGHHAASEAAAKRAALLDDACNALRAMSNGAGRMPSMKEYNERKPDGLPRAGDLMAALAIDHWGEMAKAANLVWLPGQRQ